MSFGDQFGGNSNMPITPGKSIMVKVDYEDGLEFQGLMGKVVIVATGTITVSADQGSSFQTEQQVIDAVKQTTIDTAKAFIQNFKNEAEQQGAVAVSMAATQVQLKDKELLAAVVAKIEALGLHVVPERSRIRATENKATKEASKQAQAEREAAQQRRMDATVGDAEKYAQDSVIFEQAIPGPDALTGAKVDRLTGAFATGTATVEMRDPETRRVYPLKVNGVFTLDVTKLEPGYYAGKLESTGDMVVSSINMQILNYRDVSVMDIGSKVAEISEKVTEELKAGGLDIVSVQIGRIAMEGKQKQQYDFQKKEMERAREMSDPAKAAEIMKQQMEKARQMQLDNWKAQGLTPLQGAQMMAEQAKKMFTSGTYPDGSEINAISYLKNTGFPADIIAQAEAELAAGGGAAPAAQQAAPAPAPANRPKFCMNCGKPLPPVGAFCQQCGSKI